ncbi:hypothetical protein BCR36DRAFT_449155 [Piromyces finnis]|uniref:Ricin B lectin domain-containing protein n=1 Tax=Piromyces finnis TaxID=1754191 RepID=A0A1Y1V9B3_9FUNG|nr:hypothetical protein BCR36DRAFT_449155 [Piromyces finnis]|eukprot:ORX50290.1 hypothetical protein BCR36DRAFT_449155 [Piromyces finnis]
MNFVVLVMRDVHLALLVIVVVHLKTQQYLISNLHSDTIILLMGDCNHSILTFESELLVLDATGKYIYAMNSQDPRMVDCNNADEQINHYIHFKIIDSKFICIKNSIDPEDRCLTANTKKSNSLKFKASKDECSK